MGYFEWFGWTIFFIGLFVIVKGTYAVLLALWLHFGGFSDHGKRLRSYGKWAVVTGASRGLGKQFAEELASIGLNLILVGRRPLDLIDDHARYLESKYNVDCEVVPYDLNATDLDQLAAFADKISNKDVGLLLHAAGVMYDAPMNFIDVKLEDIVRIVQVNCTSSTLLAQAVSSQMCTAKKGLIVLFSSVSHVLPTPYLTVYAASKSYVSTFIKCLQYELEEHEIFCQVLEPCYVATDMNAYSKILNTRSALVPDAKTYVQSAIKTLGLTHQTTGRLAFEFMKRTSLMLSDLIKGLVDIYHSGIFAKFNIEIMDKLHETTQKTQLMDRRTID